MPRSFFRFRAARVSLVEDVLSLFTRTKRPTARPVPRNGDNPDHAVGAVPYT